MSSHTTVQPSGLHLNSTYVSEDAASGSGQFSVMSFPFHPTLRRSGILHNLLDRSTSHAAFLRPSTEFRHSLAVLHAVAELLRMSEVAKQFMTMNKWDTYTMSLTCVYLRLILITCMHMLALSLPCGSRRD